MSDFVGVVAAAVDMAEGVAITLGNGSLLLQGVFLASLHQDDFII